MSPVKGSDINGLSSDIQNISIKINKEQLQLQTKINRCNEDSTPTPPTTPSSSSRPLPLFTSTKVPSTTIICDAWYGFPTQKRPRQERILAVSKQIYNYIEWNNTYLQEMKQCSSKKEQQTSGAKNNNNSDDNDNKKNNGKKTTNSKRSFDDDMIETTNAMVYVIGKNQDVDSIQKRVDQLLKENNLTLNSGRHNNNDEKSHDDCPKEITTNCCFLPGKSLQDLCKELLMKPSSSTNVSIKNQYACMTSMIGDTTSSFFNDTIAYLSPDADETLNPKETPPSIVIVGMLVDRKVKQNRSKSRAEEIIHKQSCDDDKTNVSEQEKESVKDDQNVLTSHLTCARLPLDALNTSDLGSDEALNIDTVLEMIQRWWYNYGKHSNSITTNEDNNKSNLQLKLFQDAAARAMLTHRNRHPKRTIHCPRERDI